MTTITLLDGYIDEPACLGVPPYISPYIRYTAGAILHHKPRTDLRYLTIDQLREEPAFYRQSLAQSDVIITIAGMTVPGRYLSGHPASPQELTMHLQTLSHPLKILTGPAARHGFGTEGGRPTHDAGLLDQTYDLIAPGDPEIITRELLINDCRTEEVNPDARRNDPSEMRDYAIKGSSIVTQHPNHPDYLLAEIETYRGCTRSLSGGCSFCSEPEKGLPQYRDTKDIVDEIAALQHHGIRHYRLGNQPCLYSYQAADTGREDLPRPNPEAIERLFLGIRTVAPDLLTLHIDNVNPGILARHPDECEQITKTILKYHTPGDVAALGVESADPAVIIANNLKASPEESMEAIKLLNRIGKKRGDNGLPHLLPGVNLLYGLKGETKTTFKLNYSFLKTILDDGLLIRRLNIRQVIPIPGTPLEELSARLVRKHKASFKQSKRKIKEEIERPLLQRLVPIGTILTDVYCETYDGNLTLGRQLGSYPLLVGIPGRQQQHRFISVLTTGHGYRSITAIPHPLHVNSAPKETLEAIPGIGKKRAARLLSNRPYDTIEDAVSSLDDPAIKESLKKYIVIE